MRRRRLSKEKNRNQNVSNSLPLFLKFFIRLENSKNSIMYKNAMSSMTLKKEKSDLNSVKSKANFKDS